MPIYAKRSQLPAPATDVYDWHSRPGALERLLPPWERIRIIDRQGGIEEGARTVIRMWKGPLPIRWVARHRRPEPGRRFVDEQQSGPFAHWRHVHRFLPRAEGSELEDEIEYRLPLQAISGPIAGGLVRRDLERTFSFRHRRTAADLRRHQECGGKPLRVAVTGASGLVGGQLSAFLSAGGHSIFPLVRRRPRPNSDEIHWKPARGAIDGDALNGLDAVVHLAGRSIAAWHWTPRIRREIRDSRIDSTRLLANTLARLPDPPRTLITASAVGYYGDRGDERLTEGAGPGTGFLPEVCQEWEEAAAPAREAGIRVINLRFGLVVTAAGGFLPPILRLFRLGLGGRLGSGWQYMSWIALDDLLGAILYVLREERLSGPVNATAPGPVTNRQFTHALGTVLRRPTPFPVPAFAIRALLGQMGDELLLFSARVEPARLEETGFRWNFPVLEDALRFELGRARS